LKKTKILCTIGPSSLSKQTIEEMYKAGMNGVRINTAYGDFNQYDSIIGEVREITDVPLARAKRQLANIQWRLLK
jgi:pyruvate kinase